MFKKILLGLGVVTIIVGIIYADRTWATLRANARTSKLNEDVDNLFSALQKYKEKVGVYPTGGNLEVCKALNGKNDKNVMVIVGPKTTLNDKGEFVDPWGSPLRIYFSDSGILIRSAGPNRRFDDSTAVNADDFYRSN
jgi:hypothetical protein